MSWVLAAATWPVAATISDERQREIGDLGRRKIACHSRSRALTNPQPDRAIVAAEMRDRQAAQPEAYSIFIDESSQTDNRFLVLGGVVVPSVSVVAIEEALLEARLPELPFGEMKWAKASRSKIEAYRRFVAKFFQFPDLHFHALVVDTWQLRHGVFNAGDRDIGFNKEIYQLVLKCGRLYPRPIFHVFPDRRSTPHSTEELRTIINHGMHKKHGKAREWPVRKFQFRDSKELPLLQMADLMSGAIAYHLNGHVNRPEASPARKILASDIFSLAGIVTPMSDTRPSGKFTIWHRRLR